MESYGKSLMVEKLSALIWTKVSYKKNMCVSTYELYIKMSEVVIIWNDVSFLHKKALWNIFKKFTK